MLGQTDIKKLTAKFSIRSLLIAAYILIVLVFSATSKAEMSVDPVLIGHSTVQSSEFVGQVAVTVDQSFYLVVSDTEYYQLASNIDLNEYNGQVVRVTGVKVLPNVEPSASSIAMDPLPRAQVEEGTTPVIVVLDISGLAN